MKFIAGFLVILCLSIFSNPALAKSSNSNYLESLFLISPMILISPIDIFPTNIKLETDPQETQINGTVELTEISAGMDTEISMTASNLNPKTQYVAVYHQNYECAIEIDTLDNAIKGAFYPDEAGKASISDKVKHRISKINSVSIRLSGDFKKVVACAYI